MTRSTPDSPSIAIPRMPPSARTGRFQDTRRPSAPAGNASRDDDGVLSGSQEGQRKRDGCGSLRRMATPFFSRRTVRGLLRLPLYLRSAPSFGSSPGGIGRHGRPANGLRDRSPGPRWAQGATKACRPPSSSGMSSSSQVKPMRGPQRRSALATPARPPFGDRQGGRHRPPTAMPKNGAGSTMQLHRSASRRRLRGWTTHRPAHGLIVKVASAARSKVLEYTDGNAIVAAGQETASRSATGPTLPARSPWRLGPGSGRSRSGARDPSRPRHRPGSSRRQQAEAPQGVADQDRDRAHGPTN